MFEDEYRLYTSWCRLNQIPKRMILSESEYVRQMYAADCVPKHASERSERLEPSGD